MTIDYSSLDSFVIFICLKGRADISDNEGNDISLEAGESILIPATTKDIYIKGEIKFLESYI
jgi:mannose-6-phosphate isomerase